MWGKSAIVVLAAFVVFLGYQWGGVYFQQWRIEAVFEALAEDSDAQRKDKLSLQRLIERRLQLNDVASDVVKQLQVARSKTERGYSVRLEYSIRKPFIGPLDGVIDFENTVTVQGAR